MEPLGSETQSLCVEALRSVRSASDADLLATLTELEGLVPQAAANTPLINAAAAQELLSIAAEAVSCCRMPVAHAALRLLNDGLPEGGLIEMLAQDVNLGLAAVTIYYLLFICYHLFNYLINYLFIY